MGRFFNLDSPVMVALTKMADLIIVNLLAFFCCLPIITVGASMTALHYVVLKIVRDEECYIVKGFFKSFKENFKQATVIWLIEVLLIIIFAADFWIIRNAQNSLPSWMSLLLIGVAILAVLALTLAFPLLAKFDNSVKMTLCTDGDYDSSQDHFNGSVLGTAVDYYFLGATDHAGYLLLRNVRSGTAECVSV